MFLRTHGNLWQTKNARDEKNKTFNDHKSNTPAYKYYNVRHIDIHPTATVTIAKRTRERETNAKTKRMLKLNNKIDRPKNELLFEMWNHETSTLNSGSGFEKCGRTNAYSYIFGWDRTEVINQSAVCVCVCWTMKPRDFRASQKSLLWFGLNSNVDCTQQTALRCDNDQIKSTDRFCIHTQTHLLSKQPIVTMWNGKSLWH